MRLVSDASRAVFRRVLATAVALGTIGGAVGVAAVSTRVDPPITIPPDPPAAVLAGTVTTPVATTTARKKKKHACYAVRIVRKGAKTVKIRVKVRCKAPRPVARPTPPGPSAPAPGAPPAAPPPVALPPASPSPPTTPPPAPPGSGSQVQIGDDDLGASIFAITAARPGQMEERCIRVAYTGTEPADVRVYLRGAPGALGTYLWVTITPGSGGVFPSCAGFSAAGAAAWSGTLSALSAHADWTGALALPSPGNDRWQVGEESAYRITAQLADDNSANGGATPLSSGSFEIVWEARDS